MKHCFVSFLAAMLVGLAANSQLTNQGAIITIQSGATIKCTGAIVNSGGGTINNSGLISSDGEFRNESGSSLTGTGIFEATTKFVNYGNAFSALKLKLIGVNTDSIRSGAGSTYDSVVLAKNSGTVGILSDAMTVNGGIRFDNDNNRLSIEDESLTLGPSATIVSADNNEFIATNSTGAVTKQSLGASPFTFEVGYGPAEYNPVTISNSGTTNNISVRCLQNVLANGLSGSPVTTDFANNSWVVSSGGAGYNLNMTGTWGLSDELASFNRNKVGIARFVSGTNWDLRASEVIAAAGTDPYTRSRNNITTAGVFAVADLDRVNAARLTMRVLLQGPYAGAGLMTDLLRDDPATGGVDPLIPTTQPYSVTLDARFTRVGVYDGTPSVNETVSSTVFNTTGNNAPVDWVLVSLMDPTTPTTKLQTRAALLQKDGDIVDLDGTSPLSMPIDADGPYHILVSHRNHLSIRTPATFALADDATTSLYDFTTGLTQAYKDVSITTNEAMAQNGSVFLMWAGNANVDQYVRVTSSAIPPIPSDAAYILGTVLSGNPNATGTTYSTGDINMDRKTRATSSAIPPIPSDVSFILGTPLAGNNNATRREHK